MVSNPGPSPDASTLWQSIRTLMEFQSQAPPLQPISRNRNLPLSFTQERLWLLNQLNPESTAYNIPFAFRLQGELNLPALEQSFQEILQRHEALRTIFTLSDGQPIQIINPVGDFKLPLVTLSNLPPQEQKTQILEQLKSAAECPFNLNQGPLLRANLIKLSEYEHILVLNIHHIVFDGWSEGVFFRELSTLYKVFSQGKSSPLSKLSIQYPDFSHWQRQWLQGEFLETLLNYWRQKLSGKIHQLRLPTDYPKATVTSHRSKYQKLLLSQELTTALKELSRSQGVTLFVTLLSTFKVLLYHYTGQEQLFVCSPTANRNRTEFKRMIGYFVNLLILQSDVSGDPSFVELLRRVNQEVFSAYAHQDLPVQQLMTHLNLGQVTLSQVMFALQNTPIQILELPGLTTTSFEIDNSTADFDLSISMVEEGEKLQGVCKYRAELFKKTTITRLLEHWKIVLEKIVAYPQQQLSSLLSLSDAEQLQLLRMRTNYFSKSASEQEIEFVAPRNDLELELTKIWAEILGTESLGVKHNFFALGGHSLLAVRLLAEMEKALNISLPLGTIFQAPTIEQFTKLIAQEKSVKSWSSLVPIQPHGNKPALFAIHYLGTNLRWYRSLATHLGLEQPVYGLVDKIAIENILAEKQFLPSLQVEDLAAYYIQEMRNFQPEGPYFISGVSFGGTIAFEMAQQLYAQGQKVGLLALFDTLSPILKDPKQGQKKIKKILQTLKSTLYLSIGQPLPRKLLNFRAQQANDCARANYLPKLYPGKITLFRAQQSHLYPDNRDMGWGNFAGGGLDLYYVPGGHSSMYDEPHVQVLAEKLRVCLEKA